MNVGLVTFVRLSICEVPESDAATRSGDAGAHLDPPDRDRVEDLVGDARDHHLGALLAELERAAEERGGRSRVLQPGVPGARGVLGREIAAVGAGEEEGGGHRPAIVTGRRRGGL